MKPLNTPRKKPLHVAFGIFAHNEECDLPRLLDDLLAQDILDAPDVLAEIHVLANGCTDRTAEVARAHGLAERLGTRFAVHDLVEGGKSRTWNRFVHDIASSEVDLLGFLDADIRIGNAAHLSGLARGLALRPELPAFVSRPLPDTAGATTWVARAILRGGGKLGNWQQAICGQCYLMRGASARNMHLPIGLPVEDGFVSAMLKTDCMETLDELRAVDGDPALSHSFVPERTLRGYLRHQERLVVGSAVNTAIFTALREAPDGTRREVLATAAEDPGWVGAQLRRQLPRRRYGWVPPSFLFKRARNMLAKMHQPKDCLDLPRVAAYFGLDLLVYVRAQLRMALGTGADFW